MRSVWLAQCVLLVACTQDGAVSQRVVRNHVVVIADAASTAEVSQEVALDVSEEVALEVSDEVAIDISEEAIEEVALEVSEEVAIDVREEATEEVALEVSEEVVAPECPEDMRALATSCIDRWEAPNVAGRQPLVMFTFDEAEAWCGARDKRLCFDDEWRSACGGAADLAYPYGAQRVPGRCNDDRTWRAYTQALLNGWPAAASSPTVESLEALMQSVRERGANAAADHVMALYQGTAAGDRPGCVSEAGVEDLVGNVEEWARRRDGGSGAQFSGALVGRYWAESRTCQSRVTVHGNAFRFYEIGFRCCRDKPLR